MSTLLRESEPKKPTQKVRAEIHHVDPANKGEGVGYKLHQAKNARHKWLDYPENFLRDSVQLVKDDIHHVHQVNQG